MIPLLLAVALVPAVDQLVKAIVRRTLTDRQASLGPLGTLRVVDTQMWLARTRTGRSTGALWIAWTTAAAAATAAAWLLPEGAWAAGLLLGGALSHLLETSIRGKVCDYVCLRFWPAFNLADVALTAGALGLPLTLVAALI